MILLSFAGWQPKVETPRPLKPAPLSVAVLRNVVADVRHRKSTELIWNSASDSLPLANYDSVKTGSHARATILFNDSASMEVAEESLVTVLNHQASPDFERADVTLPRGRVQGKIKPGGRKVTEIEIRTHRGWIKASSSANGAGATFTTTIEKDGAKRVDNSGGSSELKITSAQGEYPVKPRQIIRVKAGGNASENLEQPPSVPASEVSVETPAAETPTESLELLEPADQASTSEPDMRVAGRLHGKLRVFLNGKPIKVEGDGSFSQRVALIPGMNLLTFQVIGHEKGKIQYVTREVYRK